MDRRKAEQSLSRLFGINRFYDVQWAVIERLFKGERLLLIEKTGFGKSLCYQFPATQFSGTTVVFSPLIALMRDQVGKLEAMGISAASINSNQEDDENERILQNAVQNKYKLLYIAPERMESETWREVANRMKISMVVVDEAHCISVWGHDFRPAFRRILKLIQLLPDTFPVLATTATATPRVEEDIKKQIGRRMKSYRGNLMRPNLQLSVIQVNSEEEKLIWLGRNLGKLYGNGIVYSGTRVNTQIYADWLKYKGFSTAYYHGSLDGETRKALEADLISNTYKCIVSTNALGMGMDKADLRFIIHTQMPMSPIHYYQEIGRAGRDGKASTIILFFNPNRDLKLPQAFINGARPKIEKYNRVINAVKQQQLGLYAIIRAANLTKTQVKVILNDLMDQNIVKKVKSGGRKFYEYQFNAPSLDTRSFEALREAKQADLNSMVEYVNTGNCRMQFLCDFLGDKINTTCGVCDNDSGKVMSVQAVKEEEEELKRFYENYYPVLKLSTKSSNLEDGIAGSYYGISQVGETLNRCKYKGGGDFPDWLVQLTLRAFHENHKADDFDMVLYIPPTKSGDLVKNFAAQIAKRLKLPLYDDLVKVRTTDAQKMFNSGITKKENMKGAFGLTDSDLVVGKSVLLIDDICDSGVTLKEAGRYLTNQGAKLIMPLTIAKTVKGDL